MMLDKIQKAFLAVRVYYSQHAKKEMEDEPFGIILDQEIFEALKNAELIENYPYDQPYPSCLLFGRTSTNRPIHMVAGYSNEDDVAIIITVYQPDPQRWIEYKMRKT